MTQELLIRQPDDWHIHLRDGDALEETCRSVSRYFKRAIVMPNLVPPVRSPEEALAYRERILQARPAQSDFEPLMTLYLTETTAAEDIQAAAKNPHIYACKLYPAGATTNSGAGVRHIEKIYPVLEAMEECSLPLLIHGEVTDEPVDIFDREKTFIDRVFMPLRERFPRLKCVFEHITTKDAVDFVADSPENIAATLTAHHLLFNRNDMLVGGIKPHYYCLPVLKRQSHQQALVDIALSGHPRFFLGTDSAPHSKNAKENACGCAGIYSAPVAIELYAEFFDTHGALDKLEAFASDFGPHFYGLDANSNKIRLVKESWKVPESYSLGKEHIVPLKAGQSIQWKVTDVLRDQI